jgi:hypothetical protein
MRNRLMASIAISSLIGGFAHAASSSDQMFADAALSGLHDLVRAVAQYDQATQDSDELGCNAAYGDMQRAAHYALTNMHHMSFAPIDAIYDVQSVLRIGVMASQGCDSGLLRMKALDFPASQAIASLRYDYSIGDGDWYTISAKDDVKAKNPLQYAQSLKDQNYSWVSVRPKGMIVIGIPDWKAELASHQVNDSSIENSGDNLKAVEVDYRKESNDSNTMIYFYRTKEDALAAAQTVKQQAENDARAHAELKASDAEWRKKLTSLPYMVANHDLGFKLIYFVCKPAGKNAKGEHTCNPDGSHDWSDDRRVPYRWFGDMRGCDDARNSIDTEHPTDVKVDSHDSFVSDCMPASKKSGFILKGYKVVFALQGADYDDDTYADLRESGETATVFKTFNACYDAMDTTYSKTMKDLGTDEDGKLLNDKTKSIRLTATCVRVY